MLRLTESICLIAAAGWYAAPVFADVADLRTDACSEVPAHGSSFASGQTARSSVDGASTSAGLPYGMGEVDASSPAGDEVTALMQMHHVLARESDGESRTVTDASPLRGALTLLDSVTGPEQQHLPARLRALVYDTDEPPALGAWSVRWEAAARSHNSVSALWEGLSGEWLAPLHAALTEVQSLLEQPSSPSMAAAPPPTTADPEPDTWAVLLAGALGIGTIVRLRLFS